MAVITWGPLAGNALGVTASVNGGSSLYTLAWGDGTSEKVTPGARRQHTYAAAGEYTVSAVSTDGSDAVATRVVVREWAAIPKIEVDYTDNGQALVLTLPAVPLPRMWEIDWGDGAITQHETAAAPKHTYQWGFGKPTLRVTDLPSKRSVRFEGPTIGPEPEPDPEPAPPVPVNGVLFEYLRDRRFALRAGKLDPRTPVRFWHRSDEVNTVYTTPSGDVWLEYEHPRPSKPELDQWFSFTVEYQQGGSTHRTFIPLNVPLQRTGAGLTTYEHNLSDPRDITVSVTDHQTGVHHIDWGDGTTERVNVTECPLQARHGYSPDGAAEYRVKVTLPDGSDTQSRLVYPHRTDVMKYRNGAVYLTWSPSSGSADFPRDQFAPVVVEWETSVGKRTHRLHAPNVPERCWITAYAYKGFASTGAKGYTMYRPLAAPERGTVNVEWVPATHAADDDAEPLVVEIEPASERHTAPAGTWQWKRHVLDVTSSDYYTYCWDITNTGTEPYTPAVEFTLADPARVAEADSWRGDPVLTELGSGRWRLTQTAPVPPGEDTRLQIRVQPCGTPRVWPDNTVVT